MMWRSTVMIFSILVPSLLARFINFDPNVIDRDLDKEIIERLVPERCDTEESVKLSDLQLTEVPKQAVRSRVIRSIALENNSISNVPADIFEDVPHLQCLNLARNKIPFKQLLNFKHASLKVLIVNHQDPERSRNHDEMSQMEQQFFNNMMLETSEAYFPNLESLYLNGVNFEYFHPNFNQSFPRLTTLYMTENHLAHVDGHMLANLPRSLENLHLERNNFDTMYLDYVGNLEELYLDENPLDRVEISDSHNILRRLSISKCSLQNRVEDIFQINCPFLTELDLSANQIGSISVDLLQNTPSLQALSLSHNEFKTLPDLRHVTKLRSLSLSHNSIEVVAEQVLPSSLKLLNLRGNRIQNIDIVFLELNQLEELDLSENMLWYLPPGWAEGLNELKYLNLKSNQFSNIGDMTVSSLLELSELHIKYNVFKKFHLSAMILVPSDCTVYVV